MFYENLCTHSRIRPSYIHTCFNRQKIRGSAGEARWKKKGKKKTRTPAEVEPCTRVNPNSNNGDNTLNTVTPTVCVTQIEFNFLVHLRERVFTTNSSSVYESFYVREMRREHQGYLWGCRSVGAEGANGSAVEPYRSRYWKKDDDWLTRLADEEIKRRRKGGCCGDRERPVLICKFYGPALLAEFTDQWNQLRYPNLTRTGSGGYCLGFWRNQSHRLRIDRLHDIWTLLRGFHSKRHRWFSV